MKHILFFILILLAYNNSHAQETSNLSALFAAQKQYVSSYIAPKHRAAYLAQIHFAHIAHAKVWAEIKKIYPALSLSGTWNMLEEFSDGELTGVIWIGELGEEYYQFRYASDQKLTVT